jgi:hypothetical protein
MLNIVELSGRFGGQWLNPTDMEDPTPTWHPSWTDGH